ncbi:MAG: heme ABC exporter ATP-binding protein CcmA [Gammaproteobacteria bacterium]|nr:heme ABC exporter ATP-binding protein CcmA [Gammaproteobacteria bacterium]
MQTTPTEQTLVIDHLRFERNNITLLDQIHSTVNAGELLQVRGANGCGKSTLLRLLAGYLEPHDGAIFWQNKSITEQRECYQQNIHYVGHRNGIKSTLTVAENLKLQCALSNIRFEPTNAQAVLKKMGLQHITDKHAAHLSAGQLRRLALARLALTPNKIWILDEPTTALDTEGQTVLNELLTQHLTHGGIAIVATHQDLDKSHPTKMLHLGAANA